MLLFFKASGDLSALYFVVISKSILFFFQFCRFFSGVDPLSVVSFRFFFTLCCWRLLSFSFSEFVVCESGVLACILESFASEVKHVISVDQTVFCDFFFFVMGF